MNVKSKADSKTVFHKAGATTAEEALVKIEHKIAYAPGVWFNCGGLGLGMKYGMSEANYTSLGLTDGSFKGEDFFVGVSGYAYLAVNESIGDVRVGFQAWTTLNQSAESEAKAFIKLINNNVAFRDTFFNSMQIFITLGLNIAQI